jgi:hypothetical protein
MGIKQDGGLWVARCGLRITSFGLRVAGDLEMGRYFDLGFGILNCRSCRLMNEIKVMHPCYIDIVTICVTV